MIMLFNTTCIDDQNQACYAAYYITCLAINTIDTVIMHAFCQCLTLVVVIFYLLRCSVISRKIAEPGMFNFSSVQVVRLCTVVILVVLQSLQTFLLNFHQPCTVHCLTCLVIVVVDVGIRYALYQVSGNSDFALHPLRCSSLCHKHSWLRIQ